MAQIEALAKSKVKPRTAMSLATDRWEDPATIASRWEACSS